ncbi:MAG: group II intron reverse transcriptase domain-containing protein [Lachnospiraceae bacterium]|nr:group II intron reverse transcriptase domain-containing protein [Lachnospiraceae bacterium]
MKNIYRIHENINHKEECKTEDGITNQIGLKEEWLHFLQYKMDYGHLNQMEQKQFEQYIEEQQYLKMKQLIGEGKFPGEYAKKKIINKEGTNKKRVVYSYSKEVSITLKFIAYHLFRFDGIFCKNCYSFRHGYGVSDALLKIRDNKNDISKKYCLKVDIKNYFNSIDVEKLLEMLAFLKYDDEKLYTVFQNILLEKNVVENGKIIEENHGAMAGIPIAPFFANLYLTEIDEQLEQLKVCYFRYSDDILLFADTYEQLSEWQDLLYKRLGMLGLTINHSKEMITSPGEEWEFLGFSYHNGVFDLSANSKRKIKAKIKRKAEALRRWQRKKGLTSDKAAIGFIRAMNRKFFGNDHDEFQRKLEQYDGMENKKEDFTWSRWFFGNLTTDAGLKEVDKYMQEYIRYIVTGRHNKGNYKITYEQLKKWGYRSLVHEYYK